MGSVPSTPTPGKIWFSPSPVLPKLHVHLTALSPCTVAVWRNKLVPSLSPPPLLPAIHGSSLHPHPPTDKLGDPCSSHGWDKPHVLFPSLHQVADLLCESPQTQCWKIISSQQCSLTYQKLCVFTQKHIKEKFSLGNEEKPRGWSLGPAFLCSTKDTVPQLFQLYVPVGKEAGFTSIAIILY